MSKYDGLGDDLLKHIVDCVQEDFEGLSEELRVTMVDEAHKVTGALKESIIKEKLSDTEYFVGVDGEKLKHNPKNVNDFDYSKAYWKGRKEVVPKYKKSLHWKVGTKDVFATRSRATKGDPFVERAIAKFNK